MKAYIYKKYIETISKYKIANLGQRNSATLYLMLLLNEVIKQCVNFCLNPSYALGATELELSRVNFLKTCLRLKLFKRSHSFPFPTAKAKLPVKKNKNPGR